MTKPSIKQRVTVSILPSSTAQEEVELDYRVLVTGDYSKSIRGSHKDGATLKDRKVRVVKNKKGFQDVLKDLNPKLKIHVPNKLSGGEEEQLEVNLDITSMKDFHPDQIAQNIEPLSKLIEARERLKNLKMAVVSDPKKKKALENALTSGEWEKHVDSLLDRLAPEEKAEKPKPKKEG
jgi:type VI secretion system protein ImpB